MRRALAPILFDDDDKKTAELLGKSVVAPSERSSVALRKARRKRTKDGQPARSFQTLLKDLATVVKNRVKPRLPGAPTFDKITTPTAAQKRAFELLQVSYRM